MTEKLKTPPVLLAALLVAALLQGAAAKVTFDQAAALLGERPAATPDDAVINTLKYMRANISYAPGVPADREPHAWTGKQVVEAGTFNGCVEAAKAFFELHRAVYPGFRLVYLDSFNSAGPAGGHAVVGAVGADGQPYIVDTTAFQGLPGPFSLTDEDLAAPVSFNSKYTGKVLQFNDRLDIFATRQGAKYLLFVYSYGGVFNGELKEKRKFSSLKALNRALGEYSAAAVDMAFLRDNRIALAYLDSGRSAFMFNQAKHVIYGCYANLPFPDPAEQIEPGARKNYVETGKAGTCDWPTIK
jgi:hypothetical protein